jgi:hypothetical protein
MNAFKAVFLILPLLFVQSAWSGLEEHPKETVKISTLASLQEIISIDLKDVSLEEALATLSRKGNFKLNYNRDRIPVRMKVTLHLVNVPAAEALEKVLKMTGTELSVTAGGQLMVIPARRGSADRANGDSGKEGRVLIFSDPSESPMMPVEVEHETVDVYGELKTSKNPLSAVRISLEEMQGIPECGGGISRFLNTLPGVSFISDENLDYVVRGGSPLENGFYIDDIEVPGIGHIANAGSQGGFYSALNPDVLRNVEFLSGCFSSDYGDRLSSITRMSLREGSRLEVAGGLDMSLAGMGAHLGGPLLTDRGSFILSLRRSHLNALRSVGVDLDTVPSTMDSLLKLAYDIAPRHQLKVLNFYRSGSFRESERDIWLRTNLREAQNTFGINWASYWDKNLFSTTTLSYSSYSRSDGEDVNLYWNPEFWSLDEQSQFFNLRNSNFAVLSKTLKLECGFQIKHEREVLDHHIYQPLLDIYGNIARDSRLGLRYQTTKYGLFASGIVEPLKNMTLTLGLRGDYTTAQRDFMLAPRVSLSYDLNSKLTLNGGVGVYRQTLPLNILAYNPGSVGLKPMRAVHYVLGIDYATSSGTRFSMELYQKGYTRLPVCPDAPYQLLLDLFLDSSMGNFGSLIGYRLPTQVQGTGTAYCRGIEFLFQNKWLDSLSSVASVTFFSSRFRDLNGVSRSRVFDSQYIINLIGKFTPTPRWTISASWIMMGGGPYTPVDMIRSQQAQAWTLDEYRYLGRRYPDYNRLNLRISRELLVQKRGLLVYLDILNVFDQENVARFDWDYWNRIRGEEHQLGIIPVFGIKYTF